MSKKTLLKEATVRRFMKLANVSNLADNFINELDDTYKRDDLGYMEEQEEPEDELDMPELPGDEGPEDVGPEDVGPEDEGPEGPDLDMGEEAEEVEISAEDRDALATAIPVLQKIAGEGGAELGELEPELGELEPEEEPEVGELEPEEGEPFGGMAGEEEEEEEEPLMEGKTHNPWAKKGPNTAGSTTVSGQGLASKGGYKGKMYEGELEEDESVLDEVELVDEEEVVQEVTRRVANRLRSILKNRK
jgi:hypothetical protein